MRSRPFRLWRRGIVSAFCAALISCAAARLATAAPTVDLNDLEKKGAATQARLKTAPAAWTATHALGGGSVITVSYVQADGRQRFVYQVQAEGRTFETLRIVARDGLWYVTDANGSYKHRPFEYPAETPFIYLCLVRTLPWVTTPEKPRFAGQPVGVDGSVATYRTALDERMAQQLRAAVAAMEARPNDPTKPPPPEAQRQLEEMKKLLSQGVPTSVDLTSGRLIEFGAPNLRTTISKFRYLQADDAAFEIDATADWKDFSNDPTLGDLNDLMMMGNDSRVQPGEKRYDLDGRLVDMKTGRSRRIPFHGGTAIPCCFLPGRTAVVVSGLDSETGGVRPYRIDLKTGRNEPLGDESIAGSFTLGADLSPDGERIIVQTLRPSEKDMLASQVTVIDLATGRTTAVGEPVDTSSVGWTADGKRFVRVRRTYANLSKPAVNSFEIVDLNGRSTPLRDGGSPMLLADRKTILFEENGTRLWHTCDLNGGNVTLFGDGLKGHSFPSPGPDGKRILMMKYTAGALPQPVIIPIGQSEGQPIPVGPGLWGMPAWR